MRTIGTAFLIGGVLFALYTPSMFSLANHIQKNGHSRQRRIDDLERSKSTSEDEKLLLAMERKARDRDFQAADAVAYRAWFCAVGSALCVIGGIALWIVWTRQPKRQGFAAAKFSTS